MGKNITLVAGPCAVESREGIMSSAYQISRMRDIANPYEIDFKLRGGAWKPRSAYRNGDGEKVFEGVGEIGLKWMDEAASEFGLSVASELMSEGDLRSFNKYLDSSRDLMQIGARTAKAYALLDIAGHTEFGVVLKNPEHGVIAKETVGSIGRFEKNREIIYCTRGQLKPIHPNGEGSEEHRAYLESLLSSPDQHPDARNLNNIASVRTLQENPDLKKIKFCHDPSHIWGGQNHEMRRRIGEYGVKAITEYDYDWVMIEVEDKSKGAKCDANQALLTTTNGIDWSQTYVGNEPSEEEMPLTLVDVVAGLIDHQVSSGFGSPDEAEVAKEKLRSEVVWGAEI